MTTDAVLQAEPVLADLAEPFAQWRQTRQGHEPIPPRRWRQAGAVTARRPYSPVAKRWRLSPTDLKNCWRARPGMAPAEATPPAPTLVEVMGVALRAERASNGLVMEVERPAGESRPRPRCRRRRSGGRF